MYMPDTTDGTPLEVQLALGRLFRMMSRPYQEGDDAAYDACRAIIIDYAKKEGVASKDSWRSQEQNHDDG